MTRSLFAELKRRNVIRAALLYIGAVWALAQGISQIGPAVGAPAWTTRWFLVASAVGSPFWLAFAWFFEITPQGLKLERDVAPGESITPHTGRKLDTWIIAVLSLAVVLLLTDRFVLRRGADAESTVPEKSIAVLPFVNMSSDKEQEYFSDGIAEDLLNLLAQVQTLQVAARTSSFSFKGKDLAIPEIARTLHVANVLEGSVRKSGNEVRISVQLVRAADGYEIWSQTWDRTLDDIFKVQDEIAAAVVGQLRVKLLGAAPLARPVDPKAYPLILQAQALREQGSAEGRAQAVALLQQALATAPGEARAWVELGRTDLNRALVGEHPAEAARLAKEAAAKALALDPDNAAALAVLGRIAADFELDLSAAARYYQRALEREPGNLFALNSAAVLLMSIGRTEEALPLYQYRAAHDPANPTAYNNLGNCWYDARQWDHAIEAFRTALRLSPAYEQEHDAIGSALLLGKHDAAGALQEYLAEPDETTRLQGLALAHHALGHAQEAEAVLQELVAKYGKDQPETVATVYAYRGEADPAFAWLDKAVAARDPQLSAVLTEPLFDSLHGDPRWLQFLRKIGYAPEQIGKIELKVRLPAV